MGQVRINGLEAYAAEMVSKGNNGISSIGRGFLHNTHSRFDWRAEVDESTQEATLLGTEKAGWSGVQRPVGAGPGSTV